ncbi:undecaprenyl-phosphate glucose phosphotransferase [Hephaestia sp. GCM10023244]|uniref:undecaprenyl-phosphate glucose phosphotransferase n=1 Tax=unclassified Hephaestia TaxID=2631281 RepID=UPI00207743FF|nr:undecaprenyl-phosphate glucose phosphotransferase [Hephaestia sp. MAHUQ-44]MCM8731670.1 undecaprenyl-phosphate glucose phosphotransferase [Hephaestia sp. MAHUQ-44]
MPEHGAAVVAHVLDFGAVVAASWIAALLTNPAGVGAGEIGIARLGPAAACLLIGAGHLVGAYDPSHLYAWQEAGRRTLGAWLSATLFIVGVVGSVGVFDILPIRVLILWFVIGAVGLAVGRRLFVGGAMWLRGSGSFNRVAVIFGAGAPGVALARHLTATEGLALSLIGLCDDEVPDQSDLPVPYLGGIDDLIGLIRANIVDEVIIAMPWSAQARLRGVVERLARTPVGVRLAAEHFSPGETERQILLMAGLPLVALQRRPLTDTQRLLKAAEDRLLALLALAVLAPLMAIIAIAIKLDSPGPVLFRQMREGFNCRLFPVYKFRTMHADACSRETITQARRTDPRVTRLGAWLRRTSLDELPQLINVLLGQMSLVGPRPHAPSTRAGGTLFADVTSSYARRHNVKPGLTGWAQVNGWRGETDTEDKLIHRLNYDLDYIERWSLGFDLYILARTLWVVAAGRGAY